MNVSRLFDFTQESSRKKLSTEFMKVRRQLAGSYADPTPIEQEINDLAGCQFMLWNKYVELLRSNTVRFTKLLLDEYEIKVADMWG